MLVLSRKVHEKLLIGDDVVITVVDCGNGRVRLGIEAPIDVKVLRAELVPPGTKPSEAEPEWRR